MNTRPSVLDPVVLERRVSALEAENRALTDRALGAEQRLARAAQLYAAVSQLHQAEDTDEVVLIIKEVVANLVGCEEMGVYDVYPPGPVCTYVDGIGLDADRFGSLQTTHSAIGRALATGMVQLPADPAVEMVHDRPVSAVVPLLDGGNVCGLVVLFHLLRQKQGLDEADRDLLEVLAVHGARALNHVRLRERER